MARNRRGSNLELWTDDKGLKYRFQLGDQNCAQDLAINLRMGLVNQSSLPSASRRMNGTCVMGGISHHQGCHPP